MANDGSQFDCQLATAAAAEAGSSKSSKATLLLLPPKIVPFPLNPFETRPRLALDKYQIDQFGSNAAEGKVGCGAVEAGDTIWDAGC